MDYSPYLPPSHTPAPRVLFWIVVAVIAFLMYIVLLSSGRLYPTEELAQLCADIIVPENAHIDSVDESGHSITLSWADTRKVLIELPYEPERLFEGCSVSARRIMARAYSRAHGGEALTEKPLPKRKADSEKPTSSSCVPVPTNSNIVVLRLRGKTSGQECVTARSTDMLRVENTTSFTDVVRVFGPASVSTLTLLLRIPPHASSTISRPVGEYLSSGAHRFISDPSVAPELFVLP